MATKTITRYRTRTVRAKRRSKAGFTLPLGVVGGFAPLGIVAVQSYQSGGLPNMAEQLALHTTGWHYTTRTFNPGYLVRGWGPVVLGLLAHKIIGGKLGVNRALGRAGVPFIRI
jgi:hypothetical protein